MTGRDMLQTSTPKLDPHEQHYWIAAPRHGLKLFLRHLAPASPRDRPHPVLYVHGATFPSALSIAHRFDGFSWRDALVAAGFNVWGFDFLGFGASDRYPEMNAPAGASPRSAVPRMQASNSKPPCASFWRSTARRACR